MSNQVSGQIETWKTLTNIETKDVASVPTIVPWEHSRGRFSLEGGDLIAEHAEYVELFL